MSKSDEDTRQGKLRIYVPAYFWKRFAIEPIALSKEETFRISGAAKERFLRAHEAGHILLTDAFDPEPIRHDPPPWAERFIVLFAPEKRVTAILGDLEELFHEDVAAVGLKRANRRYRLRAFRSGFDLFYATLRKAGVWVVIGRWLGRWLN